MKILKIDACRDCMFMNGHNECTYNHPSISLMDDCVIPDWCPLEDAKEPTVQADTCCESPNISWNPFSCME